MDQVTQQNAALVEEAAAASEAMQEQRGNPAQLVSVCKLVGIQAALSRMFSPVLAEALKGTDLQAGVENVFSHFLRNPGFAMQNCARKSIMCSFLVTLKISPPHMITLDLRSIALIAATTGR